jgi:hypothetical protein
MEKARAKAKQAQERLAAAAQTPQPAPAATLPLWPDIVRAVPNGFLRSALFGAIGKGRRRFVKGEEIASLEGLQVLYTGERLDQSDLDVYESVLHALRVQAMGEKCHVTTYALLKLLGKQDTGGNRQVLHERLIRLRSTVEISNDRFSYAGGLIDEIYKDKATRHYVIKLNPKLVDLFGKDQFTLLDWELRRALSQHPLAQWLHGFYASHAQPYPMRMDTLLELSGSENMEPRSGKQKLRKALDMLVEVSNAHGKPFSYEICGDLVHVHKTPSRSQRRHLASPQKPSA